jgi:hypothetical protein
LLTDQLAWHQPRHSNPFDECQHLSCNPVQKARRHDEGWSRVFKVGFHGLNNPTNTDDVLDGAIIFGTPDGRKISQHIKSQPTPCGPVNLEPALRDKSKFLSEQNIQSDIVTRSPSFISIKAPSIQAVIGCVLVALLFWYLWM